MSIHESFEDASFTPGLVAPLEEPQDLRDLFHQRHKAARARMLSVRAPEPLKAFPAPDLPPITAAEFAEAHRFLDADRDPFVAAALAFGRANKIRLIQEAVADHFELDLLDLLSDHRVVRITLPRQIAMFLCKELTEKSLPDIGRRFGGRDHTTVLHSVRKIAALIAKDADLAAKVERIRFEIEAFGQCAGASIIEENPQEILSGG